MNKKITHRPKKSMNTPAERKNSSYKPHSNKSNRKGIDNVSDEEVMNIYTIVCNQPHLVSNLSDSIKNTCSMPYKLSILDNGSSEEYIKDTRDKCKEHGIKLYERSSAYGMANASQAHGDAIDYIIENLCKDNDLILIVDSDFFFVKKGWDNIIRQRLPINGHVTTVRNYAIHKPAAFMSLFRKKTIKNKKISFMPVVNRRGKSSTRKDVGYELEKIPLFKWVKLSNMRNDAKGSISSVDGCTNIGMGNIFFASHLSRGRSSHKNADRMNQWIHECKEYIKKVR